LCAFQAHRHAVQDNDIDVQSTSAAVEARMIDCGEAMLAMRGRPPQSARKAVGSTLRNDGRD